MTVTPTQGADQLRQYIERIERLEEEKRALDGRPPRCLFRSKAFRI